MKKILYILAIPFLAIILYYVFGTNTQNYQDTLKGKQADRVHFLVNSTSSPVVNKDSFVHPGFFSIQKKFRINAKVEHNPKTQQFAIELSNGKLETYLHYGTINFELEDEKHSLVLFQHLERTNEFLLPFGDLTNGKTSYGSGRHLPITYNGGEDILLDFNLAENPYCAYNHNYVCPLPPRTNLLNAKIEAGEMKP